MSMKTLPILFINLGGEMLYILDQRLRAQNIPKEKASKGNSQTYSSIFNRTMRSTRSAMRNRSAGDNLMVVF